MTHKFAKTFEEYFSSTDKTAFLAKLLPGTEEHTYLTLSHSLLNMKDGEAVDKAYLKKYKNLIPNHPQEDFQAIIRFKTDLKLLEAAETDKERIKISKRMNKYLLSSSFNYKRPQNVDGIHNEDEEETKLKSTFENSFYKDEVETFKMLPKLAYFDKFFAPALNELEIEEDLKKYLKIDSSLFIKYLSKLSTFSHLKALPSLLIKYLNSTDKVPIPQILDKIPLKKMNQIAKEVSFSKLHASFIEILYWKTFKKSLNEFKTVRDLKRIFLWSMSKNIKANYPSIKRCINSRMLNTLAAEGKTDVELFEDYMRDPYHLDSYFSKSFRKTLRHHDYGSLNFVIIPSTEEQLELFMVHLRLLFKQGVDILKYKKFFRSAFLKKLKMKFSLLAGNKEPKATEVFNKSELSGLNNEKFIKFVSKDLDNLKIGETIEVIADLKNVKSLIVQIFEINTINYLKDQRAKIPKNIRLDGLISVMEKTFSYDQAPIIEHREKFQFEELDDFERGVFVINFIGDGISSRIVLRRGSLQLIQDTSRGGRICYMIDHKGDVCKGSTITQDKEGDKDDSRRTGFYNQEGKFYPADSNGLINYPFDASDSFNAVLIDKGFGYFEHVSFPSEHISMSANWIYDEETFLPGVQSQMLLHLRMIANGVVVPRSNITSCSVEIEFTKENDDRTTQKFENITIKDSEDTLISFYMPSKVEKMVLKTNLGYFKVKEKKEHKEKLETTINFLSRLNSSDKSHSFLQKSVEKGNILHLKGRNGEALSKVSFTCRFYSYWTDEELTARLISDENGQIFLGQLEDMYAVHFEAEITEINISSYFYLHDKNHRKTPQKSNFILNQGEIFQIPYLESPYKKGPDFDFAEIVPGTQNVIKDMTYDVKILDKKSIKIDKLPVGSYILKDLKNGTTYRITVIKGVQLNEKLYSYGDKYLQKREEKLTIPNIDWIKQEGSIVKVKLNEFDSKTRLHAFGSTFTPEGKNYNNISDNIRDVKGKQDVIKSKAKVKSNLIEKCSLSGEMLYALKRKTMNEAIGMTSEKPSLFLKGKKGNATRYDNEKITNLNRLGDSGSLYSDEDEDNDDYDDDSSSNNSFQNIKRKRAKKKYKHMKKGGKKKGKRMRTNNYFNIDKYIGGSKSTKERYYEKIRSYLDNGSSLQANLKPNPQGIIEIDVSSFKGGFLRLYAISDNYIIQKSFTLEARENIQLKDLRLGKSRDINKTFAYVREVFKLQADQTEEISNYTTADIKIVDNLSKVIEIINSFSKEKTGVEDNWEILKNWKDEDFDNLTNYIDNNFSNELSFFIYKRDRELFDTMIKPFLNCRLQPQFMDYYLLENHKQLETYLIPGKLHLLSAIEKVLLIDALHKTHKEECQYILEILKGEDFLNDYSVLKFDYIFDKLINLEGGDSIQIFLHQKNLTLKNAEAYSEASQSQNFSDDGFGSFEFQRNNCNVVQQMIPMQQMQIQSNDDDLFAFEDEDENQNCLNDSLGFEENDEIRRSRERLRRGIPNQQGLNQRRVLPPIQRSRLSDSGDSSGDEEQGDGDSVYNDHRMMISTRDKKVDIRRVNNSSMKQTIEYSETYYVSDASGSIANKFWVDVAEHILKDDGTSFLSENFVYCPTDQIPFVVSFLDLDFELKPHEFKEENSTFSISVKNNTIMFFKHLKETERSEEDQSNNILAAQKWFDNQKRFIYDAEKNKNVEKKVEYFLKGKVYGCQLVISNVSSLEQDIQIITEIPQGSIPIQMNEFHQNFDIKIEAFKTEKKEFYFYFPVEGEYSFCPACVTYEGKRINVQTASTTIRVLKQRPIGKNLQNISDILERGSQEDILNFMNKNNISNPKVFNFQNILWLLKDKSFYTKCIQIMKKKRIFNYSIWGFAFYHGDLDLIAECFDFYISKGSADCITSSKFFRFRNKSYNLFKPKEYKPIMNSRFHQLGGSETKILNVQLRKTYGNFLNYMFEKQGYHTADDQIIYAYYLLLQDRTDEAIETINKITDTSQVKHEVQLDYMLAYFDMFTGMPKFEEARKICEKNIAYPIETWRSLFVSMANQIADFDGELASAVTDKDKQNEDDKNKVMLNCKLEKSTLNILYQNLESVKIDYFLIDLEVLFSISPFLGKEFEKLIYIKPHSTVEKKVEKKKIMEKLNIEIDENLKKKNLVIKVTGEDQKSIIVYSYTTLNITINEDSGMIKVCDENLKPLARTYVKSFAEMSSGKVEFFKDGYTDIRGSFNYCDVKNSDLSSIQRFSLFVNNPEKGSVIKEIRKPKHINKIEKHVYLGSVNWRTKQSSHVSQKYGNLMKRGKSKKKR